MSGFLESQDLRWARGQLAPVCDDDAPVGPAATAAMFDLRA